ncbi:MAG: BatA domain-containing protein, partial [Bauldia sp.]|nr:BatA domain-containing protein [Bauldia sp.]
MSGFAFTNIGMLAALLALPVIWYFLRLVPPKPRLEQFPPTRLLLEIARKEEQPARSPWWLTALRLMLAAVVILALAGPVFKPTGEVAPGDGPLLLVVDNGWASAPGWSATLATAHRVVGLAEEANRPIALLATAEPASQSLAPPDGDEIRRRLDALSPRPWGADHAAMAGALAEAARVTSFGGAAWLSDGLGGDGVTAFADALAATVNGPIVAYVDGGADLLGLRPAVGTADALVVPVMRRAAPVPAAGFVRASDVRGRVIGETSFAFATDETLTEASFTLPAELRNDIVRLDVVGAETAGAVQLLDDRWRRRRIGLLSGASVEAAQPLLSPLYYISRAVQPFADVREPNEANAAIALPRLIEGGVSVIVMADIGNLTPDVEEVVGNWVRDGGTLVRFAGPRLAAATDSLIPVML